MRAARILRIGVYWQVGGIGPLVTSAVPEIYFSSRLVGMNRCVP